MKTSLLIILSVITGIFIGVLIALTIAVNNPITRLECPYEYGECPNPGCSQNLAREYQINLEEKGTSIYDGSRLVGFLPLDTTQQLDKLMMFDNQ